MMHEKAHARAGRGGANANNPNWYNSPLWDNIGPKKKAVVETKVETPETELTEEELFKKRQREMFRYAY